MGFLEILTLIFITLKLTNVITWSWLLVFSPLIVSFTLYVLAVIYIVFFHVRHKPWK